MHGHALAQTIFSAAWGPSPGAFAVSFALFLFCGLLRPLESKARALSEARRRPASRSNHGDVAEARPRQNLPDPLAEAAADRPIVSPITLNPIELGLIAELSLEMARGEQAVAEDLEQSPETRMVASELAVAWRERAARFQLEAQRLGEHPLIASEPPLYTASPAYTGPERRKQTRRTRTRRTDPAPAPDGVGRGDRRMRADRRQEDRRRPELAPR